MKKAYRMEDTEIEEILSLVMDVLVDNANKFHMIEEDMRAVIEEEVLYRLREELKVIELEIA